MISFSLLSQKGGVGKSTVALNLAVAFAQRGYVTCLADLDPQGAIGLSLRGGTKKPSGVIGMMSADAPYQEARIETRMPNLHLLPTGEIDPSELEAVTTMWSDEAAIRRMLESAAPEVDVMILDTPAGIVGPSRAAAHATGRVLVPLQCEALSLRTVPAVLGVIAAWRAAGHDVSVLGLLLTMSGFRDETALSVLEEAWSLYPGLTLETHIPRDAAFQKASARGVPVALNGSRPPPVATTFDRLAAELEPRLNLGVEKSDDAPIYLLD